REYGVADMLRAFSVGAIGDVVATVSSDPEAPRRFASELWHSQEFQDASFGTLLPGIDTVPGDEPPARCPRRVSNMLMRTGLTTWTRFAASTPAALKGIDGCGRKVFTDICDTAMVAWIERHDENQHAPTTGTSAGEDEAPRLGPVTHDAECVLRWLWSA